MLRNRESHGLPEELDERDISFALSAKWDFDIGKYGGRYGFEPAQRHHQPHRHCQARLRLAP